MIQGKGHGQARPGLAGRSEQVLPGYSSSTVEELTLAPCGFQEPMAGAVTDWVFNSSLTRVILFVLLMYSADLRSIKVYQ